MIESFQNPKIKNLIRLTTDNRFRKKQKVFIIEGQQENERALKFNFKAIEFFICEEIFNSYLPNEKINLVSKEIYEKIAYRGTSEGIIGIYEEKENSLQDYQPSENASIIILEGIEKPGNLGAILRSCEARLYFWYEYIFFSKRRTFIFLKRKSIPDFHHTHESRCSKYPRKGLY